MDPNVDLLNSINSIEFDKHFISVYRHITNTNTRSLDDIKLSKLPKGTALNSTHFYNLYGHLILKMDKYTSVGGFTPVGYLLRPSDIPVNYIYINL